jgi:CBS domain-containing protein
MTVGSYPAFNFGVILPKTIFGESSDFTPEQNTTVEQDTPEETEENTPEMQTATKKTDSEEPDIVEGSDGEEAKQEQPSAEETPADDVAENAAAASETSEEPPRGKIFEAIRKIAQSPAILPGQSAMVKNEIHGVTGNLFEIRANDIMQNKVTWAGPDDSLQQALAKMKQTDAGYIMIGQNGVLEGIVSQSDITRAMSPYLQPIFAKWRRPLDEQGNVQGLVTAFDIFWTLLKNNSNSCAEGQTAQALVESAAPAGTT